MRIENFDRILDEDLQFAAAIQESVQSPGFRGMPLNYQERRIYHWHEELDRRIGAEHIAPELRVAPLLGAVLRELIASLRDPLASIIACGAYVPRLRLSRETIAAAVGWLSPPNKARAPGARAICNWDEDAHHAGGRGGARRAAMATRRRIDALALASTSLPFADRDGAALVAGALDLPEQLETLSVTSSLRAGTSALANAARRDGCADARDRQPMRARHGPGSPQEKLYGHGAAALLVSPRAVGAGNARWRRFSPSSRSLRISWITIARASRSFDYGLEERWVRDEGYVKLVTGTDRAGLGERRQSRAADVRHLAMPGQPDVLKRVVQAAQTRIDASALPTRCAQTAETPARRSRCSCWPMCWSVAQPGELHPARRFRSGRGRAGAARASATCCEATRPPLAAALARRRRETSYVRYLSHARTCLNVDFGMRAERDNRTAQSVAWRKHRAARRHSSVGAAKTARTVQFPPTRVCVNPECRATDTQEDHPLAPSTGRVKSFTEDWQAYSPRPPCDLRQHRVRRRRQSAHGDHGHRGRRSSRWATACASCSASRTSTGQRAFRRYFWKATEGVARWQRHPRQGGDSRHGLLASSASAGTPGPTT